MARQTGATRSNNSLAEVEVRRNDNQLADRANDAVERRAYSFFLAAGGQDGQDLTHWLQAESEVLGRIPDIREAASWYTVNVPLPGFAAEQIRVNVDAVRVLVAAEKTKSTTDAEEMACRHARRNRFIWWRTGRARSIQRQRALI
jgi:HSP20 family molecular chaperone IbpA